MFLLDVVGVPLLLSMLAVMGGPYHLKSIPIRAARSNCDKATTSRVTISVEHLTTLEALRRQER